jgi:hypothetical protein
MKIVYTDVLVIGGGLAGLRVAIAARRRGHDAVILSLVPPKRSHSAAAQGGMQASLANVIRGRGDSEDVHFEDTVRGSDWGADQRVVRMFVDTAPKAVRELAAWGVPWSRVRRGEREVVINGQKVVLTERDGKPYSGCYVNVKLDFWAQDNSADRGGKRINAQIKTVQFVADGDAFGGGTPASADGFEDLGDGADADELI